MALLATLFTCTTYGTWLRGDQRGWVNEGKILPPDPILEASDRRRLQHEPFLFSAVDLHRIGTFIGESLQSRLQVTLFALTVQSGHVHFVAAASPHDPPQIVKCAKEAVRYGLRIRRPIWTDDYDKRFCFELESLHTRILYVERLNLDRGLPPRPCPFIIKPTF